MQKKISNKAFYKLIYNKQRKKTVSEEDIKRVMSLAKKVMKDLYE